MSFVYGCCRSPSRQFSPGCSESAYYARFDQWFGNPMLRPCPEPVIKSGWYMPLKRDEPETPKNDARLSTKPGETATPAIDDKKKKPEEQGAALEAFKLSILQRLVRVSSTIFNTGQGRWGGL